MLKSRTASLAVLTLESLEPRMMLTVLMSAQEQLFLELVNRARADPAAEVRRAPDVFHLNQDVESDREISLDPKQPLAPHQSLIDAMIGHAEDMLQRNFFAHENPDGDTPSSRARDAGYPTGAGENIAWSGNTGGINQNQEVYLRHTGLFKSVGHRVNMMRTSWREIGPGVRYGSYTQDSINYQSIMAGTLFGDRGGDHFITGVTITDQVVPNNFYEIGEGLANVLVTAVNVDTSEVYSSRSGGSGGYSIQVPNGIYHVTATGDRVSRPLRIQGVQVDNANVKVDFSTRLMNSRSIEGRFFEDANGNNQRDNGDDVLPELTAYIDINRNGSFDVGEPSQTSDSTGLFQIKDLLPAEYVVRATIPAGWQPSTEGTYVINTSLRHAIGVDFALQKVDSRPVASHDQASGVASEELTIHVLQNDSDAEGKLDRDSIRIVRSPQHGQVFVRGQDIVYESTDSFSGRDSFSYTVDDDRGQRSNIANVSVEVQSRTPWKNPTNRHDVDGDGFVIPRDVLILVSELNSVGARDLRAQARQLDSPYFDVSGDRFLSPVDVLIVVKFINNQPSGEPPTDLQIELADDFFAAWVLATDDEESPTRKWVAS